MERGCRGIGKGVPRHWKVGVEVLEMGCRGIGTGVPRRWKWGVEAMERGCRRRTHDVFSRTRGKNPRRNWSVFRLREEMRRVGTGPITMN